MDRRIQLSKARPTSFDRRAYDERIGALATRALHELTTTGRGSRSGRVAQRVLMRIYRLDKRDLSARLIGGLHGMLDLTWSETLSS